MITTSEADALHDIAHARFWRSLLLAELSFCVVLGGLLGLR